MVAFVPTHIASASFFMRAVTVVLFRSMPLYVTSLEYSVIAREMLPSFTMLFGRPLTMSI